MKIRIRHAQSMFTAFVCVVGLCSKALAATVVVDGSTGVKPLVEALAKVYSKSQQAVSIQIGTGLKPKARIQALLNQDIDIAMASHGIDIEAITSEGLQVHKIAKVAVVMAVNRDVNISGVSHQQLCDIYAGKTLNWRSLHGPNAAIAVFSRPNTEVDYEVVNAHIPCFSQLQLSSQTQTKKKSGQMARALAQTSGAIGMTTMVRVAQSEGRLLALSLDDVAPTITNLLSGDYVLTRDLFLITPSNPTPQVSSFLAFIRSEKGAVIIQTNNAVPAS